MSRLIGSDAAGTQRTRASLVLKGVQGVIWAYSGIGHKDWGGGIFAHPSSKWSVGHTAHRCEQCCIRAGSRAVGSRSTPPGEVLQCLPTEVFQHRLENHFRVWRSGWRPHSPNRSRPCRSDIQNDRSDRGAPVTPWCAPPDAQPVPRTPYPVPRQTVIVEGVDHTANLRAPYRPHDHRVLASPNRCGGPRKSGAD